MPGDRLHPERVEDCRAVLAQAFEDVADLSDREVIDRAEMIDRTSQTMGEVAEQLDAPLEPEHLPALDLSGAGDLTAFLAELRSALRCRSR